MIGNNREMRAYTHTQPGLAAQTCGRAGTPAAPDGYPGCDTQKKPVHFRTPDLGPKAKGRPGPVARSANQTTRNLATRTALRKTTRTQHGTPHHMLAPSSNCVSDIVSSLLIIIQRSFSMNSTESARSATCRFGSGFEGWSYMSEHEGLTWHDMRRTVPAT